VSHTSALSLLCIIDMQIEFCRLECRLSLCFAITPLIIYCQPLIGTAPRLLFSASPLCLLRLFTPKQKHCLGIRNVSFFFLQRGSGSRLLVQNKMLLTRFHWEHVLFEDLSSFYSTILLHSFFSGARYHLKKFRNNLKRWIYLKLLWSC